MINDRFEEKKLLGYFQHFLISPYYRKIHRQFDKRIIEWIEEHNYFFGFNFPEDENSHGRYTRGKGNVNKSLIRQCIDHLMRMSGKPCRAAKSRIEQKVDNFSAVCGLDATAGKLLGFFYRLRHHLILDDLMDAFSNHRAQLLKDARFYAAILKLPVNKIEKLLSVQSPLVSNGLISLCPRDGEPELSDFMVELFNHNYKDKSEIRNELLGKPQVATLEWEDFSHLKRDIGFIETIFNDAIQNRRPGVNILLYGEPGTGKTEFSKTLCQRLGLELYLSDGQKLETDNEPDRKKRISRLSLMHRLLAPNAGACCILFDEAEDFFEGRSLFSKHTGSKIFTNYLLENNPVPTIWITNRIHDIDTAYIRRFSYTLQFKNLPIPQRKRLWNKALKKYNLRLEDEDIREIVHTYDVAQSHIDNTIKIVSLSRGGIADIRHTLRNALRAQNYGRAPGKLPQSLPAFDFNLANTDIDLRHLTRQIIDSGVSPVSFCLYGVAGSGKSLYARELANRLQLAAMHKRASDMISPFIGETEQNIARAFEEAVENQAMLIIDEADSFLQERQNAFRSWEKTMVNEMLTWMESHPLPFVCTTNLISQLDQASLRRFTFKIRFDFFKHEQLAYAFRHFFTIDPPSDLRYWQGLSSGDFAVVAK